VWNRYAPGRRVWDAHDDGGAGIVTGPRQEWTLPGGRVVRAGDVLHLNHGDYRFGNGEVLLRVCHVGDSDGTVYPTAEWVPVIGDQIDVEGRKIQGRSLSVRVRAIEPVPHRVPPTSAGRAVW
jgi:hypothetical protein